MMAPEIIVVGTSLGGLRALRTLLGGLPAGFPLPVAIVQHRGIEANDGLCALLQKGSALKVIEPEDKEETAPGRVYLAPSGYHLLVEVGAFALSTEPPIRGSRPSVDVLFESAADSYGGGTTGVILTGTGDDGALGAARIKQRGGIVIVEDPATAERGDMPRAARVAASVDHVLPLAAIPSLLVSLCRRSGS